MANAVIKHFRRYEYLISNNVITLAKTKVEITSAFSGSLHISINRKNDFGSSAWNVSEIHLFSSSFDHRHTTIINHCVFHCNEFAYA